MFNRYVLVLYINFFYGEVEMIVFGDDEYIVWFIFNFFYVGVDFIEIRRWVIDFFFILKKLRLYIDVIFVEIEVIYDYYVIMVDEFIILYFLDNDFSSNGVLDLIIVFLVNSGIV